MLLLSSEGWINGIAAIIVVLIYFYCGLFFIYKSRKHNAKRLFELAFMLIVTGCFYLRTCVEFVTVIFLGINPHFPNYIDFFLGMIWAPLSGGIGLYIATSLLIPKKKKYVLSIFLFLLITLFTIWFLDLENNVNINYPTFPGEELTKLQIILGSPGGNIIFLMMIFTISFGGFGTLIKSIQSEGVVRRKFLSLSIAWFLTHIFVVLEGYASPVLTIINKFGLLISLWFFYYGLKEAPEKIKETPLEKEISVEDGLFRIRKRPNLITEEEVSISKEKKICLVCKGSLSGYNIFVCPSCATFYCENCARALENLENACWVCNEPIDKSKPIRLEKIKEPQIISKSPEKSKKVN